MPWSNAPAPPGLSGSSRFRPERTLLIRLGLPLDLTVHLELSPAALARRTADEDDWTLDAYQRYRDEVGPTLIADVAVRVDDARHPALLER
jgi:hypothetical protein